MGLPCVAHGRISKPVSYATRGQSPVALNISKEGFPCPLPKMAVVLALGHPRPSLSLTHRAHLKPPAGHEPPTRRLEAWRIQRLKRNGPHMAQETPGR